MALPPGFVLEEEPSKGVQLPPGFQLETAPAAPAVQPEGGFIPSVKRGIAQTGILLGDILPAMAARAVGANEYAERQFREAAATEEKIKALYPAAVASYKDIKGVGDAITYLTESVGELVPSILPSLVTGGIAGIASRGAVLAAKEAAEAAARKKVAEQGAEVLAKKEVQDEIRQAGIDAARRTALKYDAVGVVGGSALQNVPEVYKNIKDETEQESLGTALLFGGFNSLLDAALPLSVLTKLRKSGIPEEQVIGAWYKRFGVGAAKGFATEGATEAAQEMSSAAAEKFIDNNIDFFSEKNLERFLNAGLKGGLGGGVLSGTTDVVLGKKTLTEDLKPLDEDIRNTQADILARRAFLDELRAQADEEGRNRLDESALKDLGFRKGSLRDSLLNKDINDPAQAQEVRAALTAAINDPAIRGRERAAVNDTLNVINEYVTTREAAPDVGQVVETAGGEGVSVPVGPAEVAAPGVEGVERTGVVPPAPDVAVAPPGEGIPTPPVEAPLEAPVPQVAQAPVQPAPAPEVAVQPAPAPAEAVAPTTRELIAEQEAGLAAQMEKFQSLLQEQVKRYGLKDVGVKVIDDLKNANGQYSKGLIQLAIDAADPVRDLKHESVHALKELGFFSPAQWQSLVKQANTTWINTYMRNRDIDGNYLQPGQQSRYDAYINLFKQQGLDDAAIQEAMVEEAIADAFGDFSTAKEKPGMIRALINRMKNFFQSIKESVGMAEVTPERLFTRVERGEVAPPAKPAKPAAQAEVKRKEPAAEEKPKAEKPEERLSIRKPETPEFKQAAAGSAIVDENGDLITMYHGTAVDITTFRGKQAGAIFVTPDPEFASGFAKNSRKWMVRHPNQFISPAQTRQAIQKLRQAVYAEYGKQSRVTKQFMEEIGEVLDDAKETGAYNFKGELGDKWFDIASEMLPDGENVMPLYILAKRPFDYENKADVNKIIKQLASDPEVRKELGSKAKPEGAPENFMLARMLEKTKDEYESDIKDKYRDDIANGKWEVIETPEVQRAIKALNFDSFWVMEGVKNLAVYDPRLIKSATGNVGTFGQRALTEEEAAQFGLEPAEAKKAQEAGDIRFSLRTPQKAPPAEIKKADQYEREFGMLPYTSEGQLSVPTEKFSIKREGKYAKHPLFDIPLNKNGTVTLYFPATNEMARRVASDKKLFGATPKSNRIYLTNESSGPKVMQNRGNIEQPMDGANVLVQVDPDLIQLDKEYADGRKDFYIPIAEGEAFAKKMAMTKLFTLDAPRTKPLSKATKLTDLESLIGRGLTNYLALDAKARKGALKNAKDVLKREHNVSTLLGENGKLEKTRVGDYGLTYEGKNVSSLGLGLASAQSINEQKLSTCPRSAICEALCLGETSGQNLLYGGEGQFKSGPRLSQYLKTEAMVLHPEEFAIALHSEIEKFIRSAKKEDYQVAIRLNVTSDFRPQTWEAIINAFPDVMFYDYTKLPTKSIAPNHQLTYSSTGASQVVNGKTIINPETNWDKMVQRMLDGSNVAMAFTSRTDMPDYVVDQATGEQFQVWNGDNYDARFLDPKPGEKGNELNRGMIIGLTNKDRTTKPEQAAEKHKGFFLDYDRERDGDTLVIKDQKAIAEGKPVKIVPLAKASLRSQVDPAITARMLQTTTARDQKGFVERITDAIGPESRSRFRAAALNRYNRLGEYDKAKLARMGGAELYADANAESAALLSDLGSGIVAGALGVYDKIGGVPVYNRYYAIEKRVPGPQGDQFIQVGGKITDRRVAEALAKRVGGSVKERGYVAVSNKNNTIKGPLAIFAPLAKYGDPDIYRYYQFWAGVKRGEKWMTNAQGQVVKEKLFTPQDIQKAKDLEKQFPEFATIQKEWITYNDALVEFLMDTGVLSKQQAAEFRKHGDYLPFYRQIQGDDDAVGPRIFQPISAVKQPRKLKGGEDPLGDFLENMVRNTQSAVQAGVKNIASRRAADVGMDLDQVKKVTQANADPINSFYVLENGEKVYYDTSDALFIESIKSLGLPDFPGIGLLSAPANVLRNLVTKDPGFMLANMMRDSLAAWTTSGVNMTPIAATLANFTKAVAGQSPEFNVLQMAGIIGGYDYSQGTQEATEQFGKELRRAAGAQTAGEKAMRPFTYLWEGLEKGTQASDAATRIEVYKSTLKETGSEAEALFRALEVMNFNRKGNNPIVRVATAAIPFLNARMQGLDVLYRAAFGKNATKNAESIQKAFWVRGMTLAALSTMYWMLTHDDEEYKRQEQETRDNNWLFPSLGIRIPIPFEVGVLFKVIPERIAALTLGDDTAQDFTKSMARNLASTLAVNPIPQTILPLVEATTNFSFFTFRPIVGQGMEGVAPAYQVGAGTSRLAEGLGGALNISPMKIDQILQGYTGTIGQYMSDMIDAVYDMHTDNPKASKRFEQLPVIKRFVVDPDARGQVTAYFDLKNAVDEATRTTNLLERSMNFDQYGKYMTENIQMLAYKDYVLDLDKTLKQYRDTKTLLRNLPMDADQKRDTIRALTQIENQLTSNIQMLKKQMQ